MTEEMVNQTNVFSELQQRVRGRVFDQSDADFRALTQPWNLAVDQVPAVVVEAADTADVAAVVNYAAQSGYGVSAQPTGHGATGTATGTILLRTGKLDGISIDAPNRRARIGAGVRSGDLQAAAAAHGLTGLPGSSPVVTVTGVALGGGLSWFGRAHGWVADSVVALEIVDAQGQLQSVTADSDPELFWALRGGGGDFGVVTSLELQLHDAGALYGGRILWAYEHAHAVLEVFRALTRQAPNELTLWLDLLRFPGGEPMVAIDLAYLGSEDEARAGLEELSKLPQPISNSCRTMTVAELGSITAEPTAPSAGLSRGELLTRLDDAAAAALLADPISPLLGVQIRHLGGSFAAPTDNPHGSLEEPYALYMLGLPITPEIARSVKAKQQELVDALPVSGRKPFTYLNPSESVASAVTPESLDRLRRIKAERDPRNVIRSNFPVGP
ncbi:FAD-binding oxidoreductase [Paenarthrobacter sp. NPDC092416]|uniref:FAD-binding oxidoreductase n=1 Tax=Paenarthrobacter sp. NPDC092416 TaxID=3364386 RepID=UPI003812D129